MVRANMQVASLDERFHSLLAQRKKLREDRDAAEKVYRAQANQFERTESDMKAAIETAYESAQKTKLLQSIHLAHMKVVENNIDVENVKQLLQTLDAGAHDTTLASLQAKLQQTVDKVTDTVFIHT